MIIVSLCFIAIAYFLYKRYIPVRGVQYARLEELDFEKINVIDLRDYNDSYKSPIKGAINIPIAYLNRSYKEIPCCKLHVISSSILEKNVGIRFLRRKGFMIIGFTIIEKSNLCYNENLCV